MGFPLISSWTAIQHSILADNQCKMLVGTKLLMVPPVDTASWASIWSTAVAVNELCVKDGKGGNAITPSKCSVLEKPLSLSTQHCPSILVVAAPHQYPLN